MNQEKSGIFKFLTSRQQYRSCRVHVPDIDNHIAAVSLDGQYYSFFKIVTDADALMKLLFRLSEQGDYAVVIPSSKGYQVWIWEHEATLVRSPNAKPPSPLTLVPSCQILSSPGLYQRVMIRVPDLDAPVPAIHLGDRYFSIFRECDNAEELVELACKVSGQALDDFAILQVETTYCLCLLEPEVRSAV